jgi:hypothetical protein
MFAAKPMGQFHCQTMDGLRERNGAAIKRLQKPSENSSGESGTQNLLDLRTTASTDPSAINHPLPSASEYNFQP